MALELGEVRDEHVDEAACLRIVGYTVGPGRAGIENAVFDTKTNLITMTGGVVLTQCRNVLRGDRLFVDMTTGVSRVEADSGKVQGLFVQSGEGCNSTPPGGGAPLPILGGPNKPK